MGDLPTPEEVAALYAPALIASVLVIVACIGWIEAREQRGEK